MMMVMSGAPPPVFRPDQWALSIPDHNNKKNSGSGGSYMEKRQLFLRSYHFSRKKSRMEKVRCSAVRVRKLICVRLRAARRLPRLLWYRLRCAWYGYRYNSYGYGNHMAGAGGGSGSRDSAWVLSGPPPSAAVIGHAKLIAALCLT